MDGYYAWMIVATALVLMMTVPALALFYGGMTRSKSVLNMMIMSFAAFAAVGIVFILWGWSEGWGGDGVGNGNGDLIANPFSMFGLHGVSPGNYIYVLFQLTFAAITAALVAGPEAHPESGRRWVAAVGNGVTCMVFGLSAAAASAFLAAAPPEVLATVAGLALLAALGPALATALSEPQEREAALLGGSGGA